MFFCRKNSPLITHYSLLKSRFRSPSLQTADVWGTLEYHGFKNPRLFALSGIASFRRLYLFTERRKRLEDANMNSRGLSSLRFIMSVYKWRLEDGNRQRRLFKRYSLNAHWSKSVIIRRIRVICVPIAKPYTLTTLCQIFLLLSTKRTLVSKWTKTTRNSSKTNLKGRPKMPYCEILTFQLRKNNFPVGK